VKVGLPPGVGVMVHGLWGVWMSRWQCP